MAYQSVHLYGCLGKIIVIITLIFVCFRSSNAIINKSLSELSSAIGLMQTSSSNYHQLGLGDAENNKEKTEIRRLVPMSRRALLLDGLPFFKTIKYYRSYYANHNSACNNNYYNYSYGYGQENYLYNSYIDSLISNLTSKLDSTGDNNDLMYLETATATSSSNNNSNFITSEVNELEEEIEDFD